MKKIISNPRLWLFSLVIALFSFGATARAELGDGLVAYWAFEGDYADSWGDFHGEARGAEDPGFVSGVFGSSAIRLNGEDQYVEITGGDENDLEFPGGDMSISGWFRVETFDTDWQAIISKGEGTNYRVARRGATDSIAYAGGVAEPAASAPNVNDGEWHHFVAISDSTTSTRLWVDGALFEETTAPPVLAESDFSLLIGENPGAVNRQWEGDLDEFAIWNRVLTDSEVGQLFNNSLGDALGLNQASIVEGLVAHWNFDNNYDDPIGGFTGEPRGAENPAFVPSVDPDFGSAISLNGEDQYVEIVGGDENNLEFPGGDMSISGWFRVAAFDTDWQALISKGEGTNYRVARRAATGSIAYAGGVGEPAAAAPNVNDGAWHHFVAISDSATGVQLWIDGGLAESGTTPPVLGESDFPLLIGENPGAVNRQWEGDIDDVAIWNRILTESEIGQLANNPIDGIINPAPIARFSGLTARANGLSIRIADTPETVVQTGSIKLIIDGVEAPADSVTAQKTDGATHIEYSNDPNFFASGSAHVVVIEYENAQGETQSIEREFEAPVYSNVDPSLMADGVDTSAGGFLVRAYSTDADIQTRVYYAEQVLRGERGDNTADLTRGPDFDRDGFGDILPSAATDGFVDDTVINYDSLGLAVGDFQDPLFVDPVLTDGTIPGTPGFQIRDTGTGNAVLEINTYIEFPERNVYTLGVTSDDGFKVAIAGSNRDALGQVLGAFDAARGTGRTLFSFLIEEPGIYPVRLLWFNGGGGSNVEFFSVRDDGVRVLINDLTTEGALAAYHARSGAEPARVTIADGLNQLVGGGNITADVQFNATIEDGASAVVDESVSLTVNGEAGTVSRSGNAVTVSYGTDGLLPPNTDLDVVFAWSDSDGRNTTSRFKVTVDDYPIVASYVTPLGSGGQPGFTWRVHQQAAARDNSTAAAEGQLALPPNGPEQIADLSAADDPDNATFFIDNWINFDQASANQGNFQSGSTNPDQQVQDAMIPGIPGTAGGTDNIAAEALSFVEFPTAGLYQMGVNSDDGFRVTVATNEGDNSLLDPNALELGVFNGGRGAADSLFTFAVQEPGVYPLRLIWYEGGGGANLEWFTVNSDGSLALVNGEQPGALKAYRTRTGTPGPFVPQPEPEPSGDAGVDIVDNGDGTLTINWTGSLQAADAVTGPYANEAGTSPMSVTPTEPARFYRVQ